MKRVRTQNEPEVSKKPKANPKVNRLFVVHSTSVNGRHVKQLGSFVALTRPEKVPFEVKEDISEVFERPDCTHGLYLEWIKETDNYILLGKIKESRLLIRFEFSAGLKAEELKLDVKKPLLAFSGGFDATAEWKNVREFLCKLFGPPAGSQLDSDHDYMFAFTRSEDMIHFRIFKIHALPSASRHKQSMSLSAVSSSFILKPLEMLPLDGHQDYEKTGTFIDKNRFMFAERQDSVYCELHPTPAYSTIRSSEPLIGHDCGLYIVMLPAVNNYWYGYNSTCAEFFERFRATRIWKVTGTGPPEDGHEQLTPPMMIFMRSLLMSLREVFTLEHCFADFTEDNIFLKRGQVGVFGVKLLQYSDAQAKANIRVVYGILTRRTRSPCPEVQSVSKYLANLASYTLDPANPDQSLGIVNSLDLVINNYAWMDSLDKHHMVSDLFAEYSTFLSPSDQYAVSRLFPHLEDWESRFASNRLLLAIRTKHLSKKRIKDPTEYEKWKAAKSLKLSMTDPNEALTVINARMYFGGVRNAFTHVPEHALKQEKRTLPPRKVDIVVSPTLGEMASAVQEFVPNAFPTSDPRSSYERFKRYFPPVSKIDFAPCDENRSLPS